MNCPHVALQPFSAQMAGLDDKAGLGSQMGLMPGSVVSAQVPANARTLKRRPALAREEQWASPQHVHP